MVAGRAGAGSGGAAGTPAPTLIAAWPFELRRPGTCSSMTMWKLVPPKPNALTPATRVAPAGISQSRSSVLTAKGEPAQSMFGLGRSKFRLGGSTLSRSASAVLRMPAAPAAPLRWPMFDFTEPSATDPGRSCAPAKALAMLWTSTTSPTRVDVPWPSTSVHSSGDRPASRQLRSTARHWPTGLGAVMPLPLPSLAPPTPRTTA